MSDFERIPAGFCSDLGADDQDIAYRSFGQTIRLTINSGRYTHDLCARQGVATDLSQSEDLQVGIATSMSMADRRRTDWH